MPIYMKCPNCRGDVGILRDRYIAPHKTSTGDFCTFTRAPFRRTKSVVVPNPPAAQLAKFKAIRERMMDDVEEVRKANALRRQIAGETSMSAKSIAQKAKSKKKKKSRAEKKVCGSCFQSVAVSSPQSTKLVAHVKSTGRWCPGGATPTESQKDQKAAGHSVWTVRGGGPLPGNR